MKRSLKSQHQTFTERLHDNNTHIQKILKKVSYEEKEKTKIKNQNKLKASTKPIFQCTLTVLKNIEKIKIEKSKDLIRKAIETTNELIVKSTEQASTEKKDDMLNVYNIGGTAVGGLDQPLPPVKAPYLPKLTHKRKFTLVLDLDETLVHFEEGEEDSRLLIRPGAQVFLKQMAELYEVVIFTAAMQDYADWVLDNIDPRGYITYRLYRQHATRTGPVFVKDLAKLGRDLSKCLIVDNVAENF